MNAQKETQRRERVYPEVKLYKTLCWRKEKHWQENGELGESIPRWKVRSNQREMVVVGSQEHI